MMSHISRANDLEELCELLKADNSAKKDELATLKQRLYDLEVGHSNAPVT